MHMEEVAEFFDDEIRRCILVDQFHGEWRELQGVSYEEGL